MADTCVPRTDCTVIRTIESKSVTSVVVDRIIQVTTLPSIFTRLEKKKQNRRLDISSANQAGTTNTPNTLNTSSYPLRSQLQSPTPQDLKPTPRPHVSPAEQRIHPSPAGHADDANTPYTNRQRSTPRYRHTYAVRSGATDRETWLKGVPARGLGSGSSLGGG